jgi:hypothetical protein
MSSLINSKLVTPCGEITNPLAGGYMDAAGNVQGALGFMSNRVVDAAGNMGTLESVGPLNCEFDLSTIGSSFEPGPWEMQLGLVETSRGNNGIISTSFPANAASPTLSSFVSVNATGYMQGIVSGTGTWTIRSGPDTIDGVNYAGAGLLVTTGANTHTGNIVAQAGTKLQLGADCTNTTTWSKGSMTINANATVTQFASMPNNTVVVENLNNMGTYNLTGCGTCGVGGKYSTIGVTNTDGTINLKDVYWRNTGIWSGIGTVNVKDGATLGLSNQPPATGTVVNINGCGWCDASGVTQGALNTVSPTTNTNLKIKVQSASCIKVNGGTNSLFSGVLSGSAPLTVSSLGTSGLPIVGFANTANTYYGTLTFNGVNVDANYGNSLQYADVVLENGARLSSSATQTIGSLSSSDPTTLWNVGGSNNVFIRDNGVTTFAGRLNMTGSIGNVWLEGGSDNVLTLTNTGHTCAIFPRNGSKLILQGATFTGAQGQVRVSAGSTVSAGTSTTVSVSQLFIDATSALDVRSTGTGTGLIAYTQGHSIVAGWKVNALDPLPPGTYPIIQKTNSTLIPAPTLGINNTGGTVTFTQVGNFVNMVVS